MANVVQQVFNPGTQKTLVRIGLVFGVVLVLAIVVGLVIRLFKKASGGSEETGIKPDGTPGTMGNNLKRLADDLKNASGFLWTVCSDLRCKTLLALAELPESQLTEVSQHYQATYGSTLNQVLEGFTLSGCCFQDAPDVVDAKLEALQKRVKNMGI